MAELSYPFPGVGEVHNYEYLFCADALNGATDGGKTRPVLVIAADPKTGRVVVMPISTKGEVDGRRTIAVPVDVGWAAHLPRPKESRIVIDEANIFTWTGFDLRPAPNGDSSKFGRATPGFVKAVRDRFVDSTPQVTAW